MLAGGSLPRYGRVRLRPLLPAVLALALVAAAPAHAGEPVRTYLSRPDLKPVVVRVLHAEAGLAPGAIFLAPGAAAAAHARSGSASTATRGRRRSSARCSTRCRSSRGRRATPSRCRTGHVRRLGVAGAHLRAEPRRWAAPRSATAARLRHVPRLSPLLGRPSRDGAGDRGGDAPRRWDNGLRELEPRDGGRGVAGPRGRLPGDPAGRRDRPATWVRDADPAPAPGPVGAGPRTRRERRGRGAVTRRLLVGARGKIPVGEQ
jgi:hypothetical protein